AAARDDLKFEIRNLKYPDSPLGLEVRCTRRVFSHSDFEFFWSFSRTRGGGVVVVAGHQGERQRLA
ncbi:MAG: hypothetical protein ACOWWM_12615, partial [Desulfobacterales bacterium]